MDIKLINKLQEADLFQPPPPKEVKKRKLTAIELEKQRRLELEKRFPKPQVTPAQLDVLAQITADMQADRDYDHGDMFDIYYEGIKGTKNWTVEECLDYWYDWWTECDERFDFPPNTPWNVFVKLVAKDRGISTRGL